MKRWLSLGLCLIVSTGFARGGVAGYYRMPTINGDQIVFTAEGDLWKTTTAGGSAIRLTSHPALEGLAHFSPDGKTIAFSAAYEGNLDIYVMPADGGEPIRLTYHASGESCVGWTPDGKYVLFTARRNGLDSDSSMYEVPATGGEPQRVNVGMAEAASFSADGKMIAFNPFVWNGTWKRYRGGTAPKIWIGDLPAGKFWKMTNDDAVDQNPMWIGDRIYYLSERQFPTNIWSSKPDGSDLKQVTHHTDYDVRFADTDGKQIVYTVAAELYVLDVKTGVSKKIETTLPSDRIRERKHVEDAAKTLESYDISDDGKRVIVSSRGEVWNAPAKPGGRIIHVTDDDAAIRQRQPAISPDGKKICVITDETGEQELAIYDAAGKEKHKILTHGGKGWLFSPTWSADGKHIAYADLTGSLYLVDPETGDSKLVDQDKNWELTEYAFSPDAKWIAYSKAGDNRQQTLFLYELASGKSTHITSGFTNDGSPAWDPQGKYLYFLSSRVFRPEMDDLDTNFLITQSVKPCLIILQAEGKSPLLPDEMLEEEKPDATAKPSTAPATSQASTTPSTTSATTLATSAPAVMPTSTTSPATAEAKKDDKKDEKKLPEVKIDLDGIVQRAVELPVDRNNCSGLAAIEGKLLWMTYDTSAMGESEDGPAHSKLHVFDFKKRKDEVTIDELSGYTLSRDGKKIAWKRGNEILVTDAGSKPGGDIDEKVNVSSLPLAVNPADEWKQIYAEAWRLQRDFYWAENMAGTNWPAMRKKYEPLLARIATRGELSDVIGQLIGELGTSHTYVFGGDSTYNPPSPVPVGVLGADIELDPASKLHQFVKVLRAEPWETETISPLTQTHARVKEGDYLLAVNGKELTPADNADAQFINLAGAQVQLSVCSKADKSDRRDIQIETLGSDAELRYADWCRRNREYVDKQTNGEVGYFHLPDMQGAGLIRFVEGFYPQINKQALIIDERSNHGGFVSQMIIEKLNRKVWAFDQPRRGMGGTYPSRVHLGYKCVLINEHAGSDGDIFPDSFRSHDLGPLIGKRTWGGVIGIRMDKGFVDHGMSSQPEFAWWDTKRGWSIENHGVDPDIEVEYSPADYVAGRDPQIDRGIAEMLAKIKEKPIVQPAPPPLPDRAPKPAMP